MAEKLYADKYKPIGTIPGHSLRPLDPEAQDPFIMRNVFYDSR